VLQRLTDWLAGARIPDAGGVVVRGGDDALARGVERRGPDLVCVLQRRAPAPRFAAPSASLNQPNSALRTRPCLSEREERTMIALYDHIQQLRAELLSCCFTRRERAAVQAELAKALAEQAELDRAFEMGFEASDNVEDAGAA
jgi:hypothetical protein